MSRLCVTLVLVGIGCSAFLFAHLFTENLEQHLPGGAHVVDCGEIGVNTLIRETVSIRNQTGSAVLLSGIRPSCVIERANIEVLFVPAGGGTSVEIVSFAIGPGPFCITADLMEDGRPGIPWATVSLVGSISAEPSAEVSDTRRM